MGRGRRERAQAATRCELDLLWGMGRGLSSHRLAFPTIS